MTTTNSYIYLQQCMVSWSLQNFRGIQFVKNTTTISIPNGYYTFSDLEKYLKSHDIVIKKNLDNTITLTSDENLSLGNLSTILGFPDKKNITLNTPTTSPNQASFTNHLKEIYISSSLVDDDKTYSYSSTDDSYTNSSLLLTLSIDTNQSLNGNFTDYNVRNYIPCKKFSGQEISFFVESKGHRDDYEVYLSLWIDSK